MSYEHQTPHRINVEVYHLALADAELSNAYARCDADDAVRAVAVVGVTEARGITQPPAFVLPVTPPEDPEALAEELKAFVKERLDPYKYPRAIHFLDDLPRTHLGKVDRARLRREAG